MAMDQSSDLFGRIYGFEWDEEKHKRNLEKHGIDFEEATEVLRRKLASPLGPQQRGALDRNRILGKPIDRCGVHAADRSHPDYLSASREEK